MDGLFKIITNVLAPYGILGIGWVLFLIERYFIGARRDEQSRTDMAAMRSEFNQLSVSFNKTVGKFLVVLEVIKERLD
jgi:hypothetical protein